MWIAFGPATGAGNNTPPYDSEQFLVEDPTATSGQLGGIGIGQRGITQGGRLKNVFTSRAAYSAQTVAAGAVFSSTFTINGCAPGDPSIANIDTYTNQNGLIITGRSSAANTGTIQLYNPTGAAITVPAGNYSFICLSLIP
jgi:hypothetical protein